ncbi:GbsR/MarR family transcriptional regulator [Jannaschia sp. W003]|uniref:GbsR/MarR family transcriptional regulator n=1 Tax=Jannaschia sp. W003 TaxID=2867012 RepID=UPI0021A69C62|nr:MarR family transcriptional regulator [Jannaschia sp. W003]UWQ23124.1 MarR family transcriptional regulator [Jannaschia sp. W003]
MTDPDPKTLFVETVGTIAQGDGLPRNTGRVMALLLWEGEAVPFGALAERLGISRGSVSSAVRMLEERGLVRRSARPGERGDRFEMAPDPFATLLEGHATRTARVGAQVGAIVAGVDSAPHRDRVARYAAFYDTLSRSLHDAAATLRDGPVSGDDA